jgi:hypothetical protein
MKSDRFAAAILFLACALLFSSCNGSSLQSPAAAAAESQDSAVPEPEEDSAIMQQLRAACPMVVEGTEATASDTENGVAFTFRTDEGDVGDLRSRVRHMAWMYEMHRGRGAMRWHHMGRRGMGGMGMGQMGMGRMAGSGPMPAAKTRITDIDKGVRLELTPVDPSQLESLREHARWQQQRMESGNCWVLEPGGTEG